ncbi:MAG: 3-deoxy-manno-octulosonate cytidylyltransferase, partial [Saprospiraceae bacterium]|nr:3-deoxy-manno-octulosonate cytidylyltransferase [Saprospiraceae bacterium]
DDKRIFDHVEDFGGNVLMTSPNHQSGTDRCAEVALQYPEYDIIVNVQGDEPFIQPSQIDELIGFLKDNDSYSIATQKKLIEDSDDLFSPNVVKVVSDLHQKALYFSRAPIPYYRGLKGDDWCKHCAYFKHIGLYAFKKKALLHVKDLPISELEKTESLEQLRWLENGIAIGVQETSYQTIGIDTPEDLEKIKSYLKSADS